MTGQDVNGFYVVMANGMKYDPGAAVRLLSRRGISRSGSSRSPGSIPTGRVQSRPSVVRRQTFGKKSDTMRSSTTGRPSRSVHVVWKYVTSIGPRRA